jgi:class 3 adenylate cyclase
VVSDHGATLLNFTGDGAHILVNAPVACPDPAQRAIDMARAMQERVQGLLVIWRVLDARLGFGVGLAMGPATVGRIGTEGRLHYTAIGNAVNLSARLCASAEDGEILIDPVAADAVRPAIALDELGPRAFKGFAQPVAVFALAAGRRRKVPQ